jgi:hypothetical protein
MRRWGALMIREVYAEEAGSFPNRALARGGQSVSGRVRALAKQAKAALARGDPDDASVLLDDARLVKVS